MPTDRWTFLPPELLSEIVESSSTPLVTYCQLISLNSTIRHRLRGTLRRIEIGLDWEHTPTESTTECPCDHFSPTSDALAALMQPCKNLESLQLLALSRCGREESVFLRWVDAAFADHPALQTLVLSTDVLPPAVAGCILDHLPHLDRLTIQGHLDRDMLESLGRERCPQLHHLALRTPESILCIFLAGCQELVSLSLTAPELTCIGSLLDTPLPRLEALNLDARAIDTQVDLTRRPALREVTVPCPGRLRLSADPHGCPGLRVLDGTPLAAGPTLLAHAATLEVVRLRPAFHDLGPFQQIDGPTPAEVLALTQLPRLAELAVSVGQWSDIPPSLLRRLVRLDVQLVGGSVRLAATDAPCLRSLTLTTVTGGICTDVDLTCPRLEELTLPNMRQDTALATLRCPALVRLRRLSPQTALVLPDPAGLPACRVLEGTGALLPAVARWLEALRQMPSLDVLVGVPLGTVANLERLVAGELAPRLAVARLVTIDDRLPARLVLRAGPHLTELGLLARGPPPLRPEGDAGECDGDSEVSVHVEGPALHRLGFHCHMIPVSLTLRCPALAHLDTSSRLVAVDIPPAQPPLRSVKASHSPDVGALLAHPAAASLRRLVVGWPLAGGQLPATLRDLTLHREDAQAWVRIPCPPGLRRITIPNVRWLEGIKLTGDPGQLEEIVMGGYAGALKTIQMPPGASLPYLRRVDAPEDLVDELRTTCLPELPPSGRLATF
ncbi:hypothetical protein PAPYR_7494 [Paratrimastix pyriformis]|uniref:F-box domain-containing protein n=1 Tax=Paratrimastix pyriformis TaxID=342808 RepID=A0ABQ8UII4_9EUKA|nr:hypothetical protein PAPYR_7494 [Paratrimastix pyriformis]